MLELDNAWVFDVETTRKCPIGNHDGSPFWPENEIVVYGLSSLMRPAHSGAVFSPALLVSSSPEDHLFVGHNIAFDIWYALKGGNLPADKIGKMQIWDTQLAEYLLSGQQQRYAKLDDVALRRGGTLKDKRVSDMFAAGMGADEVPRNMLEDYLVGDLENTRKVFWSQYTEALDRGMLPLLWSQMDARLATIEMIWNGLAINRGFLNAGAVQLREDLLSLESQMKTLIENGFGLFTPECDLDPTKPQQLAILLFGGELKYSECERVGTYKNGKPKYKKIQKVRKTSGYNFPAEEGWRGANGKFSTGDEVLETLLPTAPGSEGAKLIGMVQQWREKSKQLSTYFEGIDKLIFPDGLLHHNLNHCVTATGRLSSSDPNLQNVTNGEIKKAFVSRWGEDGYLVEADYGQLEMVMLAVLSGDEQMQRDIANGVDMHNALHESMYGKPLTKADRKLFKRRSFALVYGAGASGIAKQAGISKEEAKRFIEAFYTRYVGVEEWHHRLLFEAEHNRVYEGAKDKETGLPVGVYRMPSWSGRVYTFREYPLDETIKRWKGKDVGFSPTELKNYPVQGGATGDIVPLVLGKLLRVLKNNPRLKDKCLMVNTVHDSVLFDVHKDVLLEALAVIKATMEAAPTYVKQTFNFTFPLKLKVGLSYGPNWLDQTEVEDLEAMKEAA